MISKRLFSVAFITGFLVFSFNIETAIASGSRNSQKKSGRSSATSTAEMSPRLQELFKALALLPVNYKPEGAVCEQVARLQVGTRYPAAQYALTTGVSYDVGGDTLGELDLVVFTRADQKVVLVAEVKCWHDFGAAMDKAEYQRDRFLWNLQQNPQKMQFASSEGFSFSVMNFTGVQDFIYISQQGGQRKGFTEEIPYTLEEMDLLRENLVRCQKKGTCAAEAG